MDDVLTDHGDPEKRIADLEQTSAASRRFVATAAPPSTRQMMKYTYLIMFGAMASLGMIYMVLLLLGALLDAESVMKVGGAVVFVAFLVLAMPAFGWFQRRMNREKAVFVDVGNRGLTISSRPGEVFPSGDARLGKWALAGYGGATKGTALHLRSGAHRFVLGGRDHRAATPLDAPPVDDVDAMLWGPEFDALLAMIGRSRGSAADGPSLGQPTRCLLTPNVARMYSSSVFAAFKNTATALRLNANPPQPALAIDVGEDTISVIDLTTNGRIASASPAQVTATPAASTRSAPYMGTMTTAVLVLRVANSQPLTIACPDFAGPPQAGWSGRSKVTYRFAWRGDVPPVDEPAFVVSDADWLTLVEKFALSAQSEDRARAEGTGTASGGAPLARPKRKLWIYGVIIAAVMFVVVPTTMFVAGGIWNNRQQKENRVTAEQERPFALPFTGLRVPHGVAVDAAGNVYVSDSHTNRVVKLTAGSNTQTVLPFTGLDLCSNNIDGAIDGVAVDAAGNVYVSDSCNGRVLKLAAGSSNQTVLPLRRLRTPDGVAVDTAGAVYVVNYTDGEVLKLAPGSNTPTVLPRPGNGLEPDGDVAVDSAGNVYAGHSKTHYRGRTERYLLKLAPGSDTWTMLPSPRDNSGKDLSSGEQGVAVDTAGNVYVYTGHAGGVMKLAPGSDTWTELPGAPPFIDPLGLAVDTRGNLYVTDHLGSRATGSVPFWEDDDAEGLVLKLPAG